jgi:hypothetical protein
MRGMLLGIGLLLVTAVPADADLLRCKEVRQLGRQSSLRAPPEVPRLLGWLGSDSPLLADMAYCKLAGKRTRAIQPLLENARTATGRFEGVAYGNPASSVVMSAPPSRGIIALYLVEAIVRGERGIGRVAPRTVPELVHESISDQSALLAQAAPLYESWWAANQGIPLVALRKTGSHPLAGSGIGWR